MAEQPVLIAVDLGPAAARVVEGGLAIASMLGCPPILLHVDSFAHRVGADGLLAVPDHELERMKRSYFESATDGLTKILTSSGLAADSAEIAVVEGRPYEVVLEEAERRDAVAIVVGSHVRTGFERILLGRTALRVIRESSRGVFTIDVHRPWRGVSRIVHATDLGGGGKDAEHWTARLAGSLGAALSVVHVTEEHDNFSAPYVIPPSARTAIVTALEERLEGLKLHLADLAAEHAPGPSNISAHLVRATEPAAGILKVAVEQDADLIVVATHGRHGLARLLLGSVAEGVLNRARCSVLTVHNCGPNS